MINRLYIPLVSLILVIFCSELIQANNKPKIPVLLWSINNNDNVIRLPQSLIDDVYLEDLLNMYPNKDQTQKVAFIQKDINVEQFSQNDLPYFSRLFDENEAMFFPYSTHDSNLLNSKFDLLISLPKDTLKQNEPIIRSYMEKFNQSGPTIFILTGERNDNFNELKRVRRASDEDEKKNNKVLIFPNETNPCAYMHTTKIDLLIHEEKDKKNKWEFTDFIDLNANCTTNTDKSKVQTNFIEFTMVNTTKTFTVRMTFDYDQRIYWILKSINITGNNDEEWSNMNLTSQIDDGFSYSCSKKSYQLAKNNSFNSKYVEIVFNRFQIQPFVLKNSINMFQESFDCSVWLTLPIISSLLVCLLLILILYCGIRAVMSISTPDRFENPKSKGLILGAIDE